jgi:hypothetical protein
MATVLLRNCVVDVASLNKAAVNDCCPNFTASCGLRLPAPLDPLQALWNCETLDLIPGRNSPVHPSHHFNIILPSSPSGLLS